jgi:septal ring factor EnvC (AmiA/AmiB activator)
MTCGKPSGSSAALLLLLLLFMALVTLRGEELGSDSWIQSQPDIQTTLNSLNQISDQLDAIANYSEQELKLLVEALTQAQSALNQASQSLAESGAYQASLEQSLKQSENTLTHLERQLRRSRIFSAGAAGTSLLLLFLMGR